MGSQWSVVDEPRAPAFAFAGPPTVVGRDAELTTLESWLAGVRPACLTIEGEAGIGKTVVWEAGIRASRNAGALVLTCRPIEVETAVAYGALATLLEPALALVDGALPAPRRRALEGALRLRDVRPGALDETAVALGVVSLLRVAAEQRPVVVGIDDVQWLDPSSQVALTYALRVLQSGDDVSVMSTRRAAPPQAGDAPFGLTGTVLHLGPLSVGALHRIIRERLGSALSRPKLMRVHTLSKGNPLHAIELARAVADADGTGIGLELPVSIGDAIRARLAELSPDARTVLLFVAAAGELEVDVLTRAAEAADVGARLDEAIEHGVLALDDGMVRFAHPLLASAVYGDAGERSRHTTHMRLADLLESGESRARHLALAGTGPDEAVASALERGAGSTCRRGAHGAGATMFEQAASLTPPAEPDTRARRLVAAGQAHFRSGDAVRARAVLEEAAGVARERWRYEALCALGTLLDETVGGTTALQPFESVLASDDPELRARARRGLAQAHAYVGDLEQALAHADAAVADARRVGTPTPLVYALAMQALVRKMAGRRDWRRPLDDGLRLERTLELPDLDSCPSAFEADALRLELELDAARTAYGRLFAQAVERGDVRTECWCRFGLAAVDLAAGRWDTAGEHSAELSDLAEQTGTFRLPALRTAAQLAVLRGEVDDGRALLATAIAQAEPLGELHNLRSLVQLQGSLELSLGDFQAALPPLRRARELAEQMSVGAPSMLTFMVDEVEAHALLGDAASAAAVLMAFDRHCEGKHAPWIAPLALRARGLVEAAVRDLETARATLEAAVALEDRLPLRLERARTRLLLGCVLRRVQRRSAAHSMLTEARNAFEELGASLWAERARDELARIGGRGPSSDALTPAEDRIAALVASGLTNREVAAALFVTTRTVESALTSVYRKLGVRSRTELTLHLGSAV